MRAEVNRPYSAPSVADRSPLATLIQAVGDLKVTGYSAADESRFTWNTDPESLERLANHTCDARATIAYGIAGIGSLMYIAAGNEGYGDVSRESLRQTGLLIQYLAECLIPLSELEYALKNSTGQGAA